LPRRWCWAGRSTIPPQVHLDFGAFCNSCMSLLDAGRACRHTWPGTDTTWRPPPLRSRAPYTLGTTHRDTVSDTATPDPAGAADALGQSEPAPTEMESRRASFRPQAGRPSGSAAAAAVRCALSWCRCGGCWHRAWPSTGGSMPLFHDPPIVDPARYRMIPNPPPLAALTRGATGRQANGRRAADIHIQLALLLLPPSSSSPPPPPPPKWHTVISLSSAR